ncbi:MAG: hypothetical protein ACRDSZ_04210 [Pseudonocardiaceae bacterium]
MSGDSPYYCGWATSGCATVSHLIASRDFPTAGSARRAWCGETVTVIGLSLDARDPQQHCVERTQRLRRIAATPDSDSGWWW